MQGRKRENKKGNILLAEDEFATFIILNLTINV